MHSSLKMVHVFSTHSLSLSLPPSQEARQGLDRCRQQLASASNEVERAEANIGIDLYETLIKALE